MEEYYQSRPWAEPTDTTASNDIPETNAENQSESLLSNYDKLHLSHITQDNNEGWKSEVRHYFKDVPADVTKDMDIVAWWQVCYFNSFNSFC